MRPAVQRTPDLLRVVGLPRRKLDLAEATEHARELTSMLSLSPREALRPWQGQILHEAIMCRGVYAGAPVGLGKTLLGWLMPVVLDAERPMLIIPGGMRPDTYAFHQSYVGKWRRGPGIRIVSAEELTRVDNVDLLERERPDLLMIDEADMFRNQRASACKRIGRYVGEYEPMVCAWTGTPGRLSITDVAHFLVWCLKDGAPVPIKPGESAFWGQVLDERSGGWGTGARPLPGALELLGGGTELAGLREAFKLRLTETPGVVIVDGDSCDQPITIRQRAVPNDPILEGHFKTFRTKHVTPDGWPTSDALSVYRHSGELGSGMYLKWDPRPPDRWYGPRKTFCAFVREVIDQNEGLDTEQAVVRAYPEHPVITSWLEVKPTFTPNSVPVWLTDSVLKDVAEWLAMSRKPSLIWTWNVAFGEALATMTKLRYFGAGGFDRHGDHISSLPCYGMNEKRADVPSIILSGQANLRGRNLQAWQRNGLINPPRSARFLEQTFGRTHRAGQRDAVEFTFFMTSGDTFDGFDASSQEAGFGATTFGITQKLLRAQVVYTTVPTGSPYRWATRDTE
jgi:hypothetical protein